MKSQSYMTRALRSQDPRYARVLSKLGYGQPEPQREADKPTKPIEHTEKAMLRAEYERVIGRRPFMGWDEATLREKIAAAKD